MRPPFGKQALIGPDAGRTLQRRVIEWLDDGGTLDDLDSALAKAAPLREEQRASLWLYGWRHQQKLLRKQVAGSAE